MLGAFAPGGAAGTAMPSSSPRSCSVVSRGSVVPAVSAAPGVVAAKIFGAFNVFGFGISLATGSHVHLDLLGTGAFAAVAAATRGPDLRSRLSALAVGLWSARLTSFLFYRALQTGHDARLDETLSTTTGAFGFWLISFLWGLVTALPHSLGAGSTYRPPMGASAAAGGALFLFGLFWEVVSDFQKWAFKQDAANRGKFCDIGLWSMSQHPNYFGNLCIWTGVFLLNAVTLLGPPGAGGTTGMSLLKRVPGCWRLFLGLASPLFLAALFQGQASGAITNTVELAMKRYGDDPAYQKYIETVPLIFPRVFGRGQ